MGLKVRRLARLSLRVVNQAANSGRRSETEIQATLRGG